MDQFGFDFRDPRVRLGDWTLSLQLFTFENIYGLDATRLRTSGDDSRVEAEALGLTWAGAQETAEGTAGLTVERTDDGIAITARGTHTNTLRRAKVVLHGLPDGALTGFHFTDRPIGDGQAFAYPGAVPHAHRIHTPLLFLKTAAGDCLYFQSLETEMRPKTFAIYRDPQGNGTPVELIHEEPATRMSGAIETPQWRVGRTADPEGVVRRHIEHIRKAFGFVEWQSNPLVPDWLKQIGFIAYIHGQHWSGHIFNSYDDLRALLRQRADKLDGRPIPAPRAGWEGRYDWK